LRKPKKIKKWKGPRQVDGEVIRKLQTHQKQKGELYTRVIKNKGTKNLLLAWQIQKAEANS